MILIADSGSTKTDWIFCSKEEGVVKKINTAGLNPMVQKKTFIEETLWEAFHQEHLNSQVSHIYYFGAGCSSDERKQIIKDELYKYFRNSTINVGHDMQAAVIATCGDQPGIACILGTGSNAVFFDGEKLIAPRGTLGIGYILGDEGSGVYIGKILLRDFMYKNMPKEIYNHFADNLKLSNRDILFQVYQKSNPNTFMASFTKEISDFRDTDYTQQVLRKSFSDFFEYNITQFENYQKYPIHFIGSIATHFEKELRNVAEKQNLKIGNIVQKPIDSIVKYYLSK